MHLLGADSVRVSDRAGPGEADHPLVQGGEHDGIWRQVDLSNVEVDQQDPEGADDESAAIALKLIFHEERVGWPLNELLVAVS